MIEEAQLDELLQIVGDIRAEVVAARAQLLYLRGYDLDKLGWPAFIIR
jgi:hypothetical protein